MNSNILLIRAFLAAPRMFACASGEFGARAAWRAIRATAALEELPEHTTTVEIWRDNRDGGGEFDRQTVTCAMI